MLNRTSENLLTLLFFEVAGLHTVTTPTQLPDFRDPPPPPDPHDPPPPPPEHDPRYPAPYDPPAPPSPKDPPVTAEPSDLAGAPGYLLYNPSRFVASYESRREYRI